MTSNLEQTRESVAEAVARFAADWYVALDRHVPFEQIRSYLADGPVRFVFPESTIDDAEGLKGWYDTVTAKFFDEAHRVDVAEVTGSADGVYQVHVVVNWSTSVWTPPAASSQRLTYEADQDWEVELDADGRPRLRSYVVNGLVPLGDTPELS